MIPNDKKNNFEYKSHTVVQDNTYVAPKVVMPLKLKKKQQFVSKEQPVLKADTRTDRERKIAQEYTESVLNPSISTQIGETLQKPLRWIADPVKGIGDIVSAIAPNSALGKYLPNTNAETFEYRKKRLNPYTSNKEKINSTINEAIPLTNWALLNILPAEAAVSNMIKSSKNLIKPEVGKSATSLIKKGVELTKESLNNSVQNVYKINPWAFKPSSDNLYRGLGESGVKDAFESGVLRPRQSGVHRPRPAELRDIGKDIVTESDETVRLKGKTFDKTYYSPEFKIAADRYGHGYIAEVPKNSATFNNRYSTEKDWSMHTTEQIPIDKANILKKDWLMGYKKINAPKKQFKTDDVAKPTIYNEGENKILDFFTPKNTKKVSSEFTFENIPDRKFNTLDDFKTKYKSDYQVTTDKRTFKGNPLDVTKTGKEESNYFTRNVDDKIEKHYNNEITLQKFKDYGGDEKSFQTLIDNINTPSKTVPRSLNNASGLLTDEGVSLAVHNKYLDSKEAMQTLFHEKGHQSKIVASTKEESLLPNLWEDISKLSEYSRYTSADKGSIGMYMNHPSEIYSRIMELKYKANLKPYENFTKELLEKIGGVERDAFGKIKKMSGLMPSSYIKNEELWLKLINKAPVLIPTIGSGMYFQSQNKKEQ